MSDVIALARRSPGRLAYSTPGIGTPTHIAAELVAIRTGITWLHVPYAGSGPVLKDMLSGDVPLSFTLLGGAEPYLRAGQLKAIAVTSEHRVQALPGVPTMAESGLPDYEITSWHGIVAPAGTPASVIERLQRALDSILRDPDVVARLRTLGMEPAGGTSSDIRDAHGFRNVAMEERRRPRRHHGRPIAAFSETISIGSSRAAAAYLRRFRGLSPGNQRTAHARRGVIPVVM